ncbi:hypothetical protein VTN02DRAFT_1693 [Thermoascus thermophilus]
MSPDPHDKGFTLTLKIKKRLFALPSLEDVKDYKSVYPEVEVPPGSAPGGAPGRGGKIQRLQTDCLLY